MPRCPNKICLNFQQKQRKWQPKKSFLKKNPKRDYILIKCPHNEHMIDINFKYPIVGDQHQYVDPSKKSKGYEIIEGESIHNLRGSFVSKHDSEKKSVNLGG